MEHTISSPENKNSSARGNARSYVNIHLHNQYNKTKTMKVELFTWEKLDYVGKVKAAFKAK